MTTATPAGQTKGVSRKPLISLVIGVLLLVVVVFGDAAIGMATSGSKIPEGLISDDRVDIVLRVPFEPERYHLERLSDYGSFAGRGETPSHIRLIRVLPDDLESLSRIFWVTEIAPFER